MQFTSAPALRPACSHSSHAFTLGPAELLDITPYARAHGLRARFALSTELATDLLPDASSRLADEPSAQLAALGSGLLWHYARQVAAGASADAMRFKYRSVSRDLTVEVAARLGPDGELITFVRAPFATNAHHPTETRA